MPTCPTAQSVVLSAVTGSRAPSQSPRTRSLQSHRAEPMRPAKPMRPADAPLNREVAQPRPADGQPNRVDSRQSQVDSRQSQERHPPELPNRRPRPVPPVPPVPPERQPVRQPAQLPAQRGVPTEMTPRRRRSWACPPQRGSQQGCSRQRRKRLTDRRDAGSLSTRCSSSWSPQSQ
jgi:hypothetical protein